MPGAFRIVILALSFFGMSACGGSSGIDPLPMDSSDPGWHEGQLQHEDMERAFRFYVPEVLPDNAPVIVLLHGGTQSMDAIFRPNAGGTNEWPVLAEEENFLLLVPNGTNAETGSPTGDNQVWNDCRTPSSDAVTQSTADDVGFVMELADWMASRFPTDTERLYVTGASNGGQMAYRLAIERPDRIAAIAAFIANFPIESECPSPTTPIPVFMANGTADPITPFDGGATEGRGSYASAPATRNAWASGNDVDTTRRTVTELPDRDPHDGSMVICEDDPAGEGGEAVRFCRVDGGGHSMPSRSHELRRFVERLLGPQNHDVEGARLAWDFLRRQHR